MQYLLYAVVLLISSALLFVIQPMVGKMIHPLLGGTAAVWNVAMLFFQAILLAGYLYAHLTTRWLGTRRQAWLHLGVMAVGLLFLPVAFEPPGDPASLKMPVVWLLMALAVGVGWPFFVISASTPLLQKWFSTIDHPMAADPYHLYAASNVGSIIALLGYPFLVEPHIGVTAQNTLWAICYGLLCAGVIGCAAVLWKSPPRDPDDDEEAPPAADKPVTWRRRGLWVMWGFIPTSMFLGVTTFITTDIAPMPLLWIPPLAIYILSFIVTFARRRIIPHRLWYTLFPVALVALATLQLTDTTGPLLVVAAVHLVGLLVVCMAFHALLAEDRPHTDDLTDFYLWMSVGGVVGGVFNAVAAPFLFDQYLEYPMLLLIAALFFPVGEYRRLFTRLSVVLAAVAGAAFTLNDHVSFTELALESPGPVAGALAAIYAIPIVVGWLRARWLPLAVAVIAAGAVAEQVQTEPETLLVERSFFSTHSVSDQAHGQLRVLTHGRTRHGAQSTRSDTDHIPASYHHPDGPLGDVFFDLLNRRDSPRRVAVVGLGAGAVAGYQQPGDQLQIDFYEIDPVVERIASNTDYFTYLHFCGDHCEVILGDGRLQLDAADDREYDLIVLDAYSSTAVPVHLLTREAVETYLERLRPDGILAFQITNQYLNLEPAVANVADDLGLEVRSRLDHRRGPPRALRYPAETSDWMIMARSPEHLRPLYNRPYWTTPEHPEQMRVWTDDYVNILDVLW